MAVRSTPVCPDGGIGIRSGHVLRRLDGLGPDQGQLGLFVLMRQQPCLHIGPRHGARDTKSLQVLASHGAQRDLLTGGFDPFGQHVDAKLARHRDHRLAQRGLCRVLVQGFDKAAVDLDAADAETPDRRYGRRPGSEIIQFNPTTKVPQGREISQQHVVFILADNGFQNLDCKAVGAQAKPIQFGHDLVRDARGAQFNRAEIDADLGDMQTRGLPAPQQAQGFGQHQVAQLFAAPGGVDGVQKGGRRQQAAFRMHPTGQGFHTRDLAGLGMNLRLNKGHEFARIHCPRHIRRQTLRHAMPGVPPWRIDLKRPSP